MSTETAAAAGASPRPHCWDDVIGPAERLVARGYEQQAAFGRRPALLMLDCYRKVFGERPLPLADAVREFPSSCGLAAWAALPSLESLLATGRRVGVPVLHTTGEPPGAGMSGIGRSGPGAVTRRLRRPGDGLAGLEIVAPLAPRSGEIVLRKPRASAFFGTPLSTWLQRLDVDTIVLAGETTSGCVRATAVDAFSHGFRVVVVEEATFDRSPLSHKVSLFDLSLKYASVLHLDEVQDYLASEGVSGR